MATEPQVHALTVPPDGRAEAEVFAALGLTWREVYPLLGEVLLAPRDYRYPSRPHFATNYYTAAGVRLLVERFGLAVVVHDPAHPAPPRVEEPVPWYRKDNL